MVSSTQVFASNEGIDDKVFDLFRGRLIYVLTRVLCFTQEGNTQGSTLTKFRLQTKKWYFSNTIFFVIFSSNLATAIVLLQAWQTY